MVQATSREVSGTAVVEAHTVAQMEDEGSGIGLVPACGEGRGEMEAAVAGDEAVEDELVDVLGLGVSAHARVEVGGAGVDEEDDGVGIAWRGCGRR